jgi:hypothetical protein
MYKAAGVFALVYVSTNKYIFMKYKTVVLITVIKPLVLAAAVDSYSVNPQQQRAVLRPPTVKVLCQY